MRTSVRRTLLVASLAVWTAGCGDPFGGPGDSGSGPPFVSNPLASAQLTASRMSLSPSVTAGSGVAYVSLPPATVPGGVLATVRNKHTGNSTFALLADGGFDPVAIAAAVGDTLDITVDLVDGGKLVTFISVVPGRRRPVVVRTAPPPGKRDVTLNSTVVIIFSEPIDPRTVTPQSIALFSGGQRVGGQVLLAVGGLQVEFRSDTALAPSTEYRLTIGSEIADLDGDALLEPLDVVFTTGPAFVTVASVTLDPPAVSVTPGDTLQLRARARDAQGNELGGRLATWSSADSGVARVSASGVVTGVSLGTTTITATIDGVSATASVAVLSVVPRILVDASRDGGVWWFPQWQQEGGFDFTLPHQGKELADYFRSRGYRVDELPRPSFVALGLLRTYDIVIRAVGFGSYAPQEVAAYQQYVNEGGNLLLLGDHMLNLSADELALGFGLEFAGITRGDNLLDSLIAHPITEGVADLGYGVGSGLVAYPASAQLLGFLSAGSYLDLNKNNVQDAGEPSAPPVFGVLPYGAGRVVFCGDTNMWEWIPQPLVDNLLAWFAQP
jgi:hypothetical protein